VQRCLETKRGWGVGVGSSILGGGVKIANFCSELLKKKYFHEIEHDEQCK